MDKEKEIKEYELIFNNGSLYWSLYIIWDNGSETKHDFNLKSNALNFLKELKGG